MKQLVLALFALALGTIAQAALPLAFHNLSLATFEKQNDFLSRGLGPVTFSIYNAADGSLNLSAAGQFDALHVHDILKSSIDEPGLKQFSTDMAKRGYSARDVSVAVPTSSNQLYMFSAIYTINPAATASVWGVNDQQWDVEYARWVKERVYRVSSYIQYPENGQNRRSVTFVKDGKPTFTVFGVTEAEFNNAGTKLGAAGWEIDDFHVSLTVDNRYVFSGIWIRKSDAAFMYYHSMDANTYKQHWNELNAQGYHLKKVFGYGYRGGLFGAIWVK